MAYDELLRLLGSTNNPLETITGSGNGTGIFVGKNRLIKVELRVPGPVSGTSPTLDIKLQEATTAAGSYTDIPGGAFPQQTAAMLSGGGAVPGTGPARIAVLTSKDYVRAVKTIGGSASPSFGSVSLEIVPTDEAVG